jgi:hypothetical protein
VTDTKSSEPLDLVQAAEEDLKKVQQIAAQLGAANLGQMDAGMALSIINVRTQAVQALALARIQRDYAGRVGGLDLAALSRH